MTSIEELDAQLMAWNEQLDDARFALGALVLMAERLYGSRNAALDHVSTLLSTQITRATLTRYAAAASAFPDWQALKARYPLVGFTTFADAASLPEKLRVPYIELAQALSLRVNTLRTLLSKLKRYANMNGVAAAQALLEQFDEQDASAFKRLMEALTTHEPKTEVVAFKLTVLAIEAAHCDGTLSLKLTTEPTDSAKKVAEAVSSASDRGTPLCLELKMSFGESAIQRS